MNEKIGESQMAAWRGFLNSHATVIDHIEREMAAAGCIQLSSYDVLVALSEATGNRLRMAELANRVVLSRSGLTRLVDRLEKDGQLSRELCGTDRRGAYAVLTETGKEALEQAWPVYAQGIRKYFTSLLNDTEVKVVGEALGRISEAVRKLE